MKPRASTEHPPADSALADAHLPIVLADWDADRTIGSYRRHHAKTGERIVTLPCLASMPRPFDWLDDAGTAALPLHETGTFSHRAGLEALGLRRIFDAHCHWFPENVTRKIFAYFYEHNWPLTYDMPPEERLTWLERYQVERFTTLVYAHRPNMAAWLNDWVAAFAEKTPAAIPCGTLYPDPDLACYTRRTIEEYGFRGFKLHVQVSELDLSQTSLDGGLEQIAAAGLPVVIHIGSAPNPHRYSAPRYLRALLARHPTLTVIVAHMGSAEFADYLHLAASERRVYLDTTMVWVGFSACDPFPAELLPRLEGISGQILFGSDFPNIPYPYGHAIEGILRLPLSDAAKRRILFDNAHRLFGEGKR